MPKFYQSIIFFLTLFHAQGLIALQRDTNTVHTLREVQISASRLTDFSTGNKIEQVSPLILEQQQANTLADLLTTYSNEFIKTYGVNGLAVSSVRGLAAGSTAVLWNGFNIGSPMNGLLDFSLLPVNFSNNIKLQYGGSGALWGNGAAGGTIHLNNVADFDKGISIAVSANYGSFNSQKAHIEAVISKKKWVSSIKWFRRIADNNFSFINVAELGKPKDTLNHAELKQQGLLQEDYFKITENQKLSFRFWYQFNDRNLPPSMTMSSSEANQKDESYRTTLEWQWTHLNHSVFIRSAYFNDLNLYRNPPTSTYSNNTTQAWINEAETKITLTTHQAINMGINYTQNRAIATNYQFNPTQNRLSAFLSYRIANPTNTWKSTATLRQEFIANRNQPFVASLGIEGWLWKIIRLRGNVSSNYRLPTFNDLYWKPGGNPTLTSERSLAEELGVSYFHCVEKVATEVSISIFNNQIQNAIIWQPNTLGVWTPQNITSVWARGVEVDVNTHYSIRQFTFNLLGRYHYTLSTNQKVAIGDEETLNKQLIYTPYQKVVFHINIAYKNWATSFTHNYIGKRYTSADNTQFLTPYSVGNCDISTKIQYSTISIKTFFQINNLWDTAYQVMAYYPMPGRYYQIGIAIEWKNKIHNF